MKKTDFSWLTIGEALEYMRDYGTAIELTWGEDDQLWTCAFLTGGRRFTGQALHTPDRPTTGVLTAILTAMKQAADFVSIERGGE